MTERPRRRGRRRRWPLRAHAGILCLLLLLVAACSSGSGGADDEHAEASPGPVEADAPVVRLVEGDLEDGGFEEADLGELALSDAHAEELRSIMERNAADVPVGLPESLMAVDKRPAIVHELDEAASSGGVAGLLTVANPYAVPFSGGVVCVADWRQVPCSADSDALAVSLLPWSAVQHEVAMEGVGDATVFAVLFLEDDRRAVSSTSVAHLIRAPDDVEAAVPEPASAAAYEIEPPFPGCGVAAFHDGSDIGEAFEMLEAIDAGADASVLVDQCDDAAPVSMVALLARNRAELVDAEWSGRPLAWDRSLRLPIPESVLADPATRSLQFVYFIVDDGQLLSAHTPEVLVE